MGLQPIKGEGPIGLTLYVARDSEWPPGGDHRLSHKEQPSLCPSSGISIASKKALLQQRRKQRKVNAMKACPWLRVAVNFTQSHLALLVQGCSHQVTNLDGDWAY